MKYTLQQAENNDKDTIFEIYCKVLKGYISDIWGWDENWQKDDFDRHFANSHITKIMNGNEVIGYNQVEVHDNAIHLRMIAIIEMYQGHGIGSDLLKKLIHKSEEENKDITLQVFKINEGAINLYESMGFKIEKVTSMHYHMRKKPSI